MAIASTSNLLLTSKLISNKAGRQILLNHIPKEVRLPGTTQLSRADPNQNLELRLILSLRNQGDLTKLLQDIYNPKSPNYEAFISPADFKRRFAPSSVDLSFIAQYLKAKNLKLKSLSTNGFVLNVAGTVNDIEQAFNTRINNYQKSDKTNFYAPQTDPSIDGLLIGEVSAIVGLDNLAKYKSYSHRFTPKPQNAKNKTSKFSKPHFGSGPGCGDQGCLAPQDVKTAYNLNSIPTISNPATLQNIALFELDGYLNSDVKAYEDYFSIPENSVQLQNITLDNFDGNPTYSGGNLEVTLDIEQLIGMAYGSINTILVYEAPNSDTSWVDEWNMIANDNKAKIVSCSWGLPEIQEDAPTIEFDSQVFQQMAAQGQEVFVASGDDGALTYGPIFGPNPLLSPGEPAIQPFATGVGISVLQVDSKGAYLSESGSYYSGGGVSSFELMPSYQYGLASQANPAALVSTTMRNEPDLALTADGSTPYSFYITFNPTQGGGWSGFWGSSIAAPTWAAFLAEVNQGRAQALEPPIGFVNPALYDIFTQNQPNCALNSNLCDFHDITTGNNGYYPAEPGLDDVTGLGSFNGYNLYEDLLSYSQPNTAPPTPLELIASSGNNLVLLTWSASSRSAYYNVKKSTVSGGPYSNIAKVFSNTTYTDTSVRNGTVYHYVVSAVNSVQESTNSPEASVMPQAVPAAPTNLTASNLPDVYPPSAFLQWTQSTSVVTSNNIYRSTGNGPFKLLFTLTPLQTIFNDYNLTGQFSYYVTAVNSSGIESAPSSIVNLKVPPAPPVALNISVQGNSASLSWIASNQATSYNIKRSTTQGGPYSNIADLITGTMYTDSTAINNKVYYYVVTAVNAGGESSYSNEVTTLSPPVAYLSSLANNSVTIAWNSVAGAASYNVKKSTNSSNNFNTIATGVSGTSFTDSAVNTRDVYYYEVSAATSQGGESVNSNFVIAYIGRAPDKPSYLYAYGDYNGYVGMQWDLAYDATGFIVKRGVQSGVYTTFFKVLPIRDSYGNMFYEDPTAVFGTTYYYAVEAVNDFGSSGNSVEVSIQPIVAPGNLSAQAGDGNIVLKWAPVKGATSYVIGQGTCIDCEYSLFSTTSTTFTDTTVTNGTKYYYKVQAVNSTFQSALSNEVSAIPQRTYTVSFESLGSGSISCSSAGANCTPACSVAGRQIVCAMSSQINAGASATFTAIPNPGSAFSSWGTGVCSGASTNPCVVNINSNTNVTANFIQAQTITASAGSGGTISPSGNITVNNGANQTFTVTAIPGGSTIEQVVIDGNPITLSNKNKYSFNYTFKNVVANHTIQASFIEPAQKIPIPSSATP